MQLIATPFGDNMPRYGARPFMHLYPKGDVLIIEYDNRAPEALIKPSTTYPTDGDVYTMEDEEIEICFNGKLYPLNK